MYGSGLADVGRLGLNISISASFSTLVPMVDGYNVLAGKKVIMAAAGVYVSVLLTNDGQVFTYGHNSAGGLGVSGTNTIHYSPKPISDNNGLLIGKNVTQISVGYDTTLLVTSDGLIRCFGSNSNYNLGDGTITTQYTVSVPSPNGILPGRFFVQVSAGPAHSLALQDNGTVISWGASTNYLGRLGTATVPGVVEDPSNLIGNRKIVQISAGYQYSILVANDGRAFAFGSSNFYGQMCTGNTLTYSNPQPLAATANGLFFIKAQCGTQTTLMLTNDGRVYACGDSSNYVTGFNYTTPNPTSPTLVNTLGGLATNIHLTGSGSQSGFVVLGDVTTTAAPSVVPTSMQTTSSAPTREPTTVSPKSEPLIITRKVSLSATVTGDSSKIPQPTSSDSLVIFSSTDGTAKSQILATPEAYIVSTQVLKATYTFNVASVNSAVSVELSSSDGKKVTTTVTNSGTVNVDVSSFFTRNVRRGNQVIIGGKPITFTMNVLTPNVPTNIAKVSATVTLAVEKPTGGASSSVSYSWMLLAVICVVILGL